MSDKPRIYRQHVSDETLEPRAFSIEYPWRARIDGVSWPCETWVEAVERTDTYLDQERRRVAVSSDAIPPFV